MSVSPKTAQQLQDLSRVLLGLAIALQHTAGHEAKLLTHHAHVFHQSNKHAFDSAHQYADAAVNTAKKQMASAFTPPHPTAAQSPTPSSSTSSQPSTPSSPSSIFSATSPLSSVLPSSMDVMMGVSRAIGSMQSMANAATASRQPSASSSPPSQPSATSPFASSSPSLSSMLPSGADIAAGLNQVIGAVQSASGAGRSSTPTYSSPSPYPSSSSSSSSTSPSFSAGPLSSMLPSGADIAMNVGRVLGAVQRPLSAVSSLSSAGTAAASNAMPLLSSLPLPHIAAALVSSALPPGVPRPSAEQVNSAVNAVLTVVQQVAQQLSQQANLAAAATSATSATPAPPTTSVNIQSPYPSSAASLAAAASDMSVTIQPPPFVDINPPAASSPSSATSSSFDSTPASPDVSSSSDTLSSFAAARVLGTVPPSGVGASSMPPVSSDFTSSASSTAPFDLPPPAFLSQPTSTDSTTSSPPSQPQPRSFEPRSRAVPSSPIGRVLGFGGIAMRMLTGTVVDATKRIWGGDDTANIASTLTPTASHSLSTDAPNSSTSSAPPSPVSRFLSPANTERLAEGLCRMRGAALKIGQMLSIQDDALLPPPLAAVLARVRDSADMMPQHQLRSVLSSEWGDNWEAKLDRFDEQPIAAASIGQVHRGSVRGVGEIVVKVQYPGVADSIESDVENVRRLINWFNIAPKGLYLDKTMDAAKEELSAECDYRTEAANQTKFRELLRSSVLHPRVTVPAVVETLCTRQVLVSEWVEGVPIDRLEALPQAIRDRLCRDLVQLCLLELFVWRFMQTDPNWSNFLYDTAAGTLHLVDFGACIAYRKQFIDDYLRMVYACAERDSAGVIEYSRRLGFITGEESREMLNAHVAAALIIGEPFSAQYAAGYDFAAMNMSGRVSELARVMVRLRLTAPPKESYTLHRKLSGCFLTCKKLHAHVSLRDTFMEVYRQYRFS